MVDYWFIELGIIFDSLETIQERDKIKNNFCAEKGYPLVRIPYTKINQMTLEDIMGDKYLLER